MEPLNTENRGTSRGLTQIKMIDIKEFFDDWETLHVMKVRDEDCWGVFGMFLYSKGLVAKGFRLPTNAVHFANSIAKEQHKDVYWHKIDGTIRKVFYHSDAKNKSS